MNEKRCETCHHWRHDSELDGYESYCGWTPPPLPFWASINDGDHQDYVTANQGKKCPTWTELEAP